MGRFQHVFKSLRIRDGLTQEQLAKKLKISRSSIAMYEQGKREPEIDKMEVIADFFNVDMNYLTGTFDKEYYTNLQSRQIAQELFENPELRLLFDTVRDVPPEDLLIVAEIARRIKNTKR